MCFLNSFLSWTEKVFLIVLVFEGSMILLGEILQHCADSYSAKRFQLHKWCFCSFYLQIFWCVTHSFRYVLKLILFTCLVRLCIICVHFKPLRVFKKSVESLLPHLYSHGPSNEGNNRKSANILAFHQKWGLNFQGVEFLSSLYQKIQVCEISFRETKM